MKTPPPTRTTNRRLRTLAAVIVGAGIMMTSCASAPEGPLPPEPTVVTRDVFDAEVEAGSPAVVNVWASWCLPCRSEAPLIAAGARAHPEVTFIGLNVKDDATDATEFMARYLADASMVHLADPSGRIPIDLGGGSGVPVTFFYASDGTLTATHRGVIDEPTLARLLDEIDR